MAEEINGYSGSLMDNNVPSQLDEDDLKAEMEIELPDSQNSWQKIYRRIFLLPQNHSSGMLFDLALIIHAETLPYHPPKLLPLDQLIEKTALLLS